MTQTSDRPSRVHPVTRDGEPRRRWDDLEPARPSLVSLALLALLVVVAGAVAGVLFGRSVTPLYGARAEFIFDAYTPDPTTTSERVATQASVLGSQTVLEAVARQFETDVETLRDRVQVDRAPEGAAVTLTASDEDVERALGIAQAVVKQYGAAVSATFSTDLVTQYLEAEVARLETRRAEVQAAAAAADEDEEPVLTAQLRAVEDQLAANRSQIREIRAGQLASAAALHLVSPPYVLEQPVSPSATRYGAIGALLGLGVALAVVSAIVLLRRTAPVDR